MQNVRNTKFRNNKLTASTKRAKKWNFTQEEYGRHRTGS